MLLLAQIFSAFYFYFLILKFVHITAPTKGSKLLCGRNSREWHGPCLVSSHCDAQCWKVEDAVYGKCEVHYWVSSKCVCYFLCWSLEDRKPRHTWFLRNWNCRLTILYENAWWNLEFPICIYPLFFFIIFMLCNYPVLRDNDYTH